MQFLKVTRTGFAPLLERAWVASDFEISGTWKAPESIVTTVTGENITFESWALVSAPDTPDSSGGVEYLTVSGLIPYDAAMPAPAHFAQMAENAVVSSIAKRPVITEPDGPMQLYVSIWTGAENLDHRQGAISAEANFATVRDDLLPLSSSSGGGNVVSFAGQADGLEIDMAAGTYARALKVLPIGDSLTLGVVNTEVDDVEADLDGYRYDLFEQIVAAGQWIDYVGDLQNGPQGMQDTDNLGIAGKHLSAIVDDAGGSSDFSDALAEHLPDVVLFMAGTNDVSGSDDAVFFSTVLPEMIANIEKAIDQFYSYAGTDEKYLVISTIPPKTKGGVPVEYSEFINQGYSIVDSEYVIGDAGNGTFVPGIMATVEALKLTHPTLILFQNPVTEMSQLSFDNLHIADVGYQEYATALAETLYNEIGETAFSDLVEALPTATEVVGGEGGDRIGGDANANTIRGGGGADYLEGRGGADTLEGGTGLDVFAYGLDALDGTTDTITDYSIADGDIISLGAIIDSFGWTDTEIAANVSVTDTAGGAEVSITTLSGTYVVALVENVAASDVTIATTQFTEDFVEPDELVGSDDNDTLFDVDYGRTILGLDGRDTIYAGGGDDIIIGGAGGDWLYGEAGADTHVIHGEDIGSKRDQIMDFSIADGDTLDLSGIADYHGWTASDLMDNLIFKNTASGDLRVSLVLPSETTTFLLMVGLTATDFLASDALILDSGPAPDSGDDDGNMVLTVPDTDIDASEVSSVMVTLTGLDADATAVVTLTTDGIELSQATAVDGDLLFDLSTMPDGPVTTSVTATDGNGNSTTVAGPDITLATTPDLSADEDGNLAITAPDLLISDTEAASVVFDISGIDADATGIVTVTDHLGATVTGAIALDGQITLDLRPLADGEITASITVTDGQGNTATVDTPAPLTLDQTTDTTADIDGNLAVTAPDTSISLGEETAVVFDVTGLDADATAVVQVTDGATMITSAVLSTDGSMTLDLSTLADGGLSVSVIATDAAANTATATGPALTLDTSELPANSLLGTDGDDTLKDGNDSSTIMGLAGDDRLYGNDGDDVIFGGDGDDLLRGDLGNDTLYGGAGSDTLRGKDGADVYVFTMDDLDGSTDRIDGFSADIEGDLINISDIVSDYGWTETEAESYVLFEAHNKGIYVQLAAPGLDQTLIDIRDITLSDISTDHFVFL